MIILKPVYIVSIFILLSLSGFSQPVNPVVDSLIHLVTSQTYRLHFDSLRTQTGCNRKVYGNYLQGTDHDACRDYIFRSLKKYLGNGNVYLHDFKAGDNNGLANVIAYKQGKSSSGRILIVSAHYDSNNSRESGDTDPVCSPGANDNGTGVAAILEIARVISGIETDQSILFAAWDFEEQFPYGYAGGSNCWFLDHVVRKNNKIRGQIKNGGKIGFDKLAANINFDMFGHPNDTVNGKPVLWACLGNVMHTGFINEYVSTVNRYVPEIKAVNHGKLIYSDHYTFADRKIPSVENLESDYSIDPFYHTCSDNLENKENIDFNFTVDVTRGGMAFILEKAGIAHQLVNKIPAYILSDIMYELPDAYCVKTPVEDLNVIVVDRCGNYMKTVKKENSFLFYPHENGLYKILIYSNMGNISKNIFLQKKEGFNEPFF
jgi:hypothetical protein